MNYFRVTYENHFKREVRKVVKHQELASLIEKCKKRNYRLIFIEHA